MSVNFSTITPMNPATISKAPTYTTAAASQGPAASSPMDAYQQPKKKSHWFRNTLIAAALVVGGAALLRGKVDMFKNFDKTAGAAQDAGILGKVAHYGKKAVAEVGDFVNKYVGIAYNWVASKFASKPAGTP